MDRYLKILESKKILYSLLLSLNEDEISDNELDIMELLAGDEQIQKLLLDK